MFAFRASPGFRERYERVSSKEGIMTLHPVSHDKVDAREDYLVNLFILLGNPDSTWNMLGLNDLMNEIGLQLGTEENNRRVSETLLEIIGDLSLLGTLKHQLTKVRCANTFLANIRSAKHDDKNRTSAKHQLLNDTFKLGLLKHNDESLMYVEAILTLITKNGGKFRDVCVPSLDGFWLAFDGWTDRKLKYGKLLAAQIRCLPRSEEERSEIHGKASSSMSENDKVLAQLLLKDTKTPKHINRSEGANPIDDGTWTSIQRLPSRQIRAPPCPYVYKVSRSEYNMLSMIFFDPSHSNQSGKIRFDQFLRFMVKRGFQYERKGGSRIIFTCSGTRMMFHDYHSDDLPWNIAKRFGNRLNFNLGWSLGNFTSE